MTTIESQTTDTAPVPTELTLNEVYIALGAAVGAALKSADVTKSRAAAAIGLSRTQFLGRLAGATCFEGAEMNTIARLTGPGLATAVADILKRAPQDAPKEHLVPADVNAAELVAAWPTGGTTRYALRYMEKTVDGVRWINRMGLLTYLSELLGNAATVDAIEHIVAPPGARLGRFFTFNAGHKTDEFDDYFYPEPVAVRVVAAVLDIVDAVARVLVEIETATADSEPVPL